jgi:hypothetical protein
LVITRSKRKLVLTKEQEKKLAPRNPYSLLVGIQINKTTMKSSVERPQKTRDRTAI